MIRRATIDDLDAMREMVFRFGERTDLAQLGLQCDSETVEDFLVNVIAAPKGVIFAAEDEAGIYGGIIGIIEPWMFNKNIQLLTELGWFVRHESREAHPFAGASLYLRLVRWGKEQGATMACFSSTTREEAEEVRAMYKDRGFIHMDSSYVGRL
jgi:hypothetical protein